MTAGHRPDADVLLALASRAGYFACPLAYPPGCR